MHKKIFYQLGTPSALPHVNFKTTKGATMKSLIVKSILIIIVAIGFYCQFHNPKPMAIENTLTTRNAMLQEALHYE